MVYVIRDFNSPKSDIGDITLFLSNNHKICVNILNLHDIGQELIYVKYPSNMDMYDIFLSILNKITTYIYEQINELVKIKGILEFGSEYEIPEYKDIICISEPRENSIFSNHWGNYLPFTSEYMNLLTEYESDRDDERKNVNKYIIKATLFESGEFIYDKPIRVKLDSDDYESDI